MALLTYQPFKALYVLSALTFEVARMPLWLVKYFFSYGRQHPEWTFGQALGVRIFFSFVYHAARVQVATPLPLLPNKEKERFVLIEPAADKLYVGPLRSNADVKPVKIGGTWYPAPLSKDSDKSKLLVILHIHGGAFIIGDGRTEASGFFAKNLQQHAGATHVFMPQYRLSTLPASKTSNPFPAALQDCVTSYAYLIHDLKIPAKDIVISGDSAGGNAAICLLRYLSEYGAELKLPKPSAALFWSPWLDLVESSRTDFTRNNPNYNTDYLSYPFTRWGTEAYAGVAGLSALSNPWITLKGQTFETDVPMFVNTGTAEALYFDDVEWASKMKDVTGNRVTLDEERGAPHDILLLGDKIGWSKQAGECAKRAGEWMKQVRK